MVATYRPWLNASFVTAVAGFATGLVVRLADAPGDAIIAVPIVAGLVGAVAFGVSLVRDRLYGQDLSDLEYVATRLQRSAP